MAKIVLASASPRRKKLLEQIGIAFEVYPSNAEEVSSHKDPVKLVEELALLKASDVSSKFTDTLIIGADTIVVYDQKILGKPNNEMEAVDILQSLSGTTHLVYTGVAFVKVDKNGQNEREYSFHEQTKVTFSTLDESEIQAYVATGNPMDKAGAYGIQDDLGALFVEGIEGDFYNVVGLPLNRFYREFKKFMPQMKLLSQ